MAIQIIKQGRLPEEKRWSFCCRNCDTEFTAHTRDGQHYFKNQKEGEGLSVSCPLCNKQVTSQTEYIHEPFKPQYRGWQDHTMYCTTLVPIK